MEEIGPSGLEVDIKANPTQGLSFILWNACAIVIDARNPIRVRFDTMDGIEDTLEPYWDDKYRGERNVIAGHALDWEDRQVLRMRYRAARGLMFRKQFDGEKDVKYEDDDI